MSSNSPDLAMYIDILPPQDSSRFEFINREEVVNLAAFLFQNCEYLVYAASFLTECKNVEEYNRSKLLEEYYMENYGTDLKPEDIECNRSFIQLLYSFYSLCDNEGRFANYRGGLLERITLLFACQRYMYSENIYLPINKESLHECCDFDIDCKVRLNLVNWTTPNPIDVAGWNQAITKGEGYECKININDMKDTDISILNNLVTKCCNSRYINIFNVGVVTFSNVQGIEYYLDYLADDQLHKDINIYGRNNIQDIIEAY